VSSDEEPHPSGKKEDNSAIGKLQKNRKCLPKPKVAANVSKVRDRMKQRLKDGLIRRSPSACLYIGDSPASLGIPDQDMRAAFCLNRGNVSCLTGIPLFSATCANEQMEEVCRLFVAQFVKIIERDGKTTRAILPHYCRGLKRKLINDLQALLAFVWQFQPKERSAYTRNTQVRFQAFRREPRRRQEMKRLIFEKSELNVDVGEEVDAGSLLEPEAEDGTVINANERRASDHENKVQDTPQPSRIVNL
jgi:hypothetical protein